MALVEKGQGRVADERAILIIDDDRSSAACSTTSSSRGTYRVPWADLLQKVFAVDVLACPECTGRMQVIAFIAQATVAKRILDHLGLDSTGPPLGRPAPPPEHVDLGASYDAHDAVDPIYPE